MHRDTTTAIPVEMFVFTDIVAIPGVLRVRRDTPYNFRIINRGSTMSSIVQIDSRDSIPSLEELAAMSPQDRSEHLEKAAKLLRDEYANNPEMTAFTALDNEDFVDV